jgi:hypothetical protein
MNATLAKNFRLGGDQRLQVRADFFSVFNKKNWGSPVSAINASDFGRIAPGWRSPVDADRRPTILLTTRRPVS